MSVHAEKISIEKVKLPTKKTKNFFDGEWKIKSGNQSRSSDNTSSTRFFMSGDLKSQINFHPKLSFQSEINLRLTSLQGQDQFVQEPGSGIHLNEGLIKYKPIKNLDFSMGAVNQSFVPMKFFISKGRSFPGFKEELCIKLLKSTCLTLKAQQVVPTSFSFSSQRTQKEEQPSLLSEVISFNYEPKVGFQVETFGALFDYSNLPAITADNSRKYGNSVQGSGALAKFDYEFKGWTAGGKFGYRFNKYDRVSFSAHLLQNDKAPFEKSKAQFSSLAIALSIGDLILEPELQYHFIEQDAIVATYMPSTYSMTNTEGITVFMGIKFKKYNFKLITAYRNIHPIVNNANVFQEDEEIYELRLETEYASF